jgi:hypothetical protein
MSSFRSAPTAKRLGRRLALLAATAGACVSLGAAAQTDTTQLRRVEVNGQTLMAPERYDVRASCAALEDELVMPLEVALMRERVGDELRVSFVLSNGQISDVRARGTSHVYETAVKRAVTKMHCMDAQAATSPQVYAFKVAFIDPYTAERRADTQTAGAEPTYRVAVLSR